MADGDPLTDTKLLSIPVLVDADNEVSSPRDRLFVDVVHVALTRLLLGEEPLSSDTFVVNFSIGILGANFAGRTSALGRLLDWWASEHGVLFVVSAGNITEALPLPGISTTGFEDATLEEVRNRIDNAMKDNLHRRTLLAPSEAINVLTVGAVSSDLAPPGTLPEIGFDIDGALEVHPSLISAVGPGHLGSIKPDLLAVGGKTTVRAAPNGGGISLGAVERNRRSGLIVASADAANSSTTRTRGTSCAAALTTRFILKSAEALVSEGGPFEGLELPRRDIALLTRALAVNASYWPESARRMYNQERDNGIHHSTAKKEVAKRFGHGELIEAQMIGSPEAGVTLVGLGSIRKDGGKLFEFPLPQSLSGLNLDRSMRVTLAWFSPVNPSRAQYRLAALEAAASADTDEDGDDDNWSISMKSAELDHNQLKKGTIWSKRLVRKNKKIPTLGSGSTLPIRVQCRDAAAGGLDQDEEIQFAIAVTLETEITAVLDVFEEVRNELSVRARGLG